MKPTIDNLVVFYILRAIKILLMTLIACAAIIIWSLRFILSTLTEGLERVADGVGWLSDALFYSQWGEVKPQRKRRSRSPILPT